MSHDVSYCLSVSCCLIQSHCIHNVSFCLIMSDDVSYCLIVSHDVSYSPFSSIMSDDVSIVSHAVSYSPISSIMSHNVLCCLIRCLLLASSVSYCLTMSHDVSWCLIMSHDVSYCLSVSCCPIQSHCIYNVS